MRIRIRDATHRDLPRIMEIERRAFKHPWSFDSFVRELSLPFSRLMVASIDGLASADNETLVGYLCRWIVADECHILNIAVDPKIRRAGVGFELMNDVISEAIANKSQIVALEVRRSNLPARGLYRKFNFEERRLRRNYYGPGEHAIVMELRLN